MTTVDLEQQRLLIGGEWVEASGGDTFERSDPLTGDTVTRAAAAGRDDARKAVDAAAAAFPAWAATPAGERRKLLNQAADTLMEAAPDIAAAMTEEVGGTFGWGMFNCDLASRMLREAAAQAYSVVGEVIPSDVPGSLAMGIRQPAGVVVGMAPWNAPVILAPARSRRRSPTATRSCSKPASSARAPTPRSCARWSTPASPTARST
jgi:acyl-CoA reductase-like NAD-dependent aldehyde dehydrogenase